MTTRPPRRARTVTALVVALGTLAGCGFGAPTGGDAGTGPAPALAPDQQVTISFESYNLSQAGTWTDTFTELLAEFRREHPNITVEPRKPQGTSANGVQNAVPSVQAQVVTGTPPDVAQLGFGDLDFAADQLGAKALDDLVGRGEVDAALGGEHPYAPTARGLGDVDGKTYGMPFVFSTPVLFYNASLFRAAGLDPERPPRTWAEVKSASQAIKASTGRDGSYVDCLTQAAGDWCYQSLVASNGGSVIAPDRSRMTFAEPAAVEAVAMAQDLVTSGASPRLSQAQAYPQFARGEMGMLLESSSLQGSFVKSSAGKWDLRSAPMPAFDGKPTAPTNSGAALFVTSNDPAKQRAAWELIRFLTSERAYTTIAQEIGYLPLRTGLVDDPRYLQAWASRNPLLAPNLEQLTRLRRWESFPGNDYIRIQDTMMGAVETAVFNGADPTATLAAAAAQTDPLLPATR